MWEETRPLPSLHLTPVNVVPAVVMSSTVYSPLLSNCRPSLPSQRVSFNLFYTTNRVTATRYLPFFHFQNDLSYTRPLSVKLFATKFDSDRPTHAEEENQDPSPSLPSSNKVSFAVATGELFLGIASRLIGRRRKKLSSNSIMNSTTKDDPILFVLGNQSNSEPIKTLDIDNYAERIATVEDSQSEVLWEQRVKDVEAEDQRKKMIATTSPGFSFSAAGLLFPYHLGVARFLIENGYINETTPLAGSSAGAIICATIASGASMEEALNATKTLAHDCRTNGTAFRLGTVLRDILNTFLPDDVHIRSNGRVRVAITQLLWRPRGLLVDQFDSKEDLINAIITSSFIPGYLAPRPATMFRNRVCIDGGLTLFMPPTSADQTVRVCAFPATQLGLKEIGISPDCNPEDRPTSRQLFNWALEPAEDYVLDKLFEFGYSDAAVWAYNNPITDILHQDRKPF